MLYTITYRRGNETLQVLLYEHETTAWLSYCERHGYVVLNIKYTK